VPAILFALCGACSGSSDVIIAGDDGGSAGDAGHDATIDAGGDSGTHADSSNNDAGDATIEAGDDVSSGGCNMSTDCPQQQACDPGTHTCSSSCAGGLQCNGGCCQNGQTCVPGDQNTACGNTGAGCSDCTQTFQMCSNGICSNGPPCMYATDCPPGEACDKQSGQCSFFCGGATQTDCNGGCCANGYCSGGNQDYACGSSGACTDCTSTCNPGPKCLNQACGCSMSTDCMVAGTCGARQTCDNSMHCN
jgi:hypothetical protein